MRIYVGYGVNEDRIRANIAKRKAVQDKKDDAQAFLAGLADKAKVVTKEKNERQRKADNRRHYASQDLRSIGYKAIQKAEEPARLAKAQAEEIEQYGQILDDNIVAVYERNKGIYMGIGALYSGGMKNGKLIEKGLHNYGDALDKLSKKIPKKKVDEIDKDLYDDENDNGFDHFINWYDDEISEAGIRKIRDEPSDSDYFDNYKASKATITWLNKKAKEILKMA